MTLSIKKIHRRWQMVTGVQNKVNGKKTDFAYTGWIESIRVYKHKWLPETSQKTTPIFTQNPNYGKVFVCWCFFVSCQPKPKIKYRQLCSWQLYFFPIFHEKLYPYQHKAHRPLVNTHTPIDIYIYIRKFLLRFHFHVLLMFDWNLRVEFLHRVNFNGFRFIFDD